MTIRNKVAALIVFKSISTVNHREILAKVFNPRNYLVDLEKKKNANNMTDLSIATIVIQVTAVILFTMIYCFSFWKHGKNHDILG